MPLPFDWTDYEYVLDVPEVFELFGINEPYWQRYITNERPVGVARTSIRRGGQPYTRYRIAFASSQVPADGTHYCWLPLRLNGGDQGASTEFFFQRYGNRNITECKQRLPVGILPAVSEKQPRPILLSQYFPNGYHTLAPRLMRATIARPAAIGFNRAVMAITEPVWGPQWNAYLKSFHHEL